MPVGGGMQPPPSGFTNACVLCSTTCPSGGYPVTLTCWHYTKHWSSSTCNWQQYGLKLTTMDVVNRAALLFNTLQVLNLFCLFFFFFLNVWITNWMVLKGEVKDRRPSRVLDCFCSWGPAGTENRDGCCEPPSPCSWSRLDGLEMFYPEQPFLMCIGLIPGPLGINLGCVLCTGVNFFVCFSSWWYKYL